MEDNKTATNGIYPIPDDIDRAFRNAPAEKRRLDAWLLPVVTQSVGLALRPIARAFDRDIRQEMEEFVQDTWLMLLKDGAHVLRMWDPSRGRSLSSWVRLVTERHILRTLKGHRRNPWANQSMPMQQIVALLDDGLPLRPTFIEDLEVALYLERLFDDVRREFNEQQWRLFNLIFIEQRDLGDLVGQENMSLDNLHKWASRLRKRVCDIARDREAA